MSPLTRRVLKDTYQLSKRYVFISLIAGFFSSVYPLVSIYISRRIIDLLGRNTPYETLIRFILIGLLLVFVSQIISGLFNYVHQFEQSEMYQRLELSRNLKSIAMEFRYAEDPAVKEMRQNSRSSVLAGRAVLK